MLIVRGTKKLRDRMKNAPVAAPNDQSTTALGDWFATALFWKPQVALLVNARTMIPVFTPLAPAGELLDRAPEAIGAVLRAHRVPDEAIAAELEAMTDVRLAPTNNRQIVGVMNEFAFQGEGAWGAHDPDLFSMSMRLSELVLGPLMNRHGTPAGELAAIFASDSNVIAFPTAKATIDTTAQHVHQPNVTTPTPGYDAIGTWRIVEMDLWELDAIELVGPALIEVGSDGLGHFGFIAVEADIDWKPASNAETGRIDFSWAGDDEGDQVSGRGSASVNEVGELVGHLYFHHGDDSGFRAVRNPT